MSHNYAQDQKWRIKVDDEVAVRFVNNCEMRWLELVLLAGAGRHWLFGIHP